MKISLLIEGQQGLNWQYWKKLVPAIDSLGFYGLYRSDHYVDTAPPNKDSLEMITSITWASLHTSRSILGPMVAPVSFRDPVMLARQALALHDLSRGRFVLGLGSGWQEREHAMFGYELGTIKQRMDRLEESLQVVRLLLDNPNDRVSYTGHYYHLDNALLLPRGYMGGRPKLLVGGSGRSRVLPLVAKYADIWNSLRVSPEQFRDLSAYLNELCGSAGRDPGEIHRSLFTSVFLARESGHVDEVLREAASYYRVNTNNLSEIAEYLGNRNAIWGTPDMVIDQMRMYRDAGVQELVLRWIAWDDLERLEALADLAQQMDIK